MELNRINDIAAFVAAVRAGSFTRAAVTLGLSRSAVGKCIVRLEESLGVRLLNRTTRSLSLTDEGKIMFERCRQILQDLEEVDEAMATRRMIPTGTFRISVPLSFGQRHVLPVLDNYLRKWPDLRADLSLNDRYVDLIEEGYDLAIRIGNHKEDSRLLSRTIAYQHMITCASPAYLERHGWPISPEELNNHDTIIIIGAEKRVNWYFSGPDGHYLFNGMGRIHLDSSEAALASALAGLGIAHIPTYLSGDELHAGRLIRLFQQYEVAPEPIRLLYPSRKQLSPRVRLFIDLLTECWKDGISTMKF